MRRVSFFTLGCKVNQYETQSIRESFLERGFLESAENDSDWCVINTCTVTSSADAKSRNIIRHLIRKNPDSKIVVTGCLVAKDHKTLSEIKGIDYIISKSFFADSISDFKGRTRAFLKIQDGCDNFCSYCKVPYVRGLSRSRPEKDIINEAGLLAKKGFREVVLTGICLGSYPGLARLVKNLEKISGILRIRLSSIEAGDVNLALIKAIKNSSKLCPHLHIPIQSGDDAVLKRMRRSYTHKRYLSLIQSAKKEIKGLAVTTDVIIGFPAETEAQFKNTVSLVKAIKPLKVHIFPYSPRPGTAAAGFSGQIAPEIIKDRMSRLKLIAEVASVDFRKQFVNINVDVLIEGPVRDDPKYLEGFTENYIKVFIPKRSYIRNDLIRVRLKEIIGDAMLAESCVA